MLDNAEHALELINASVALVVLYFGVRAFRKQTLPLQRLAVGFFLVGTIAFATVELLAVAALLGPDAFIHSAVVELLRELTETVFVTCMAVVLLMLQRSERHELRPLSLSADTDALTGVHNFAYFQRAAKRRFDGAREHDLPLFLILLDFDDFKAYNDEYGHAAANIALRRSAETLQHAVRADDILARFGGEEFVVVGSDGLDEALQVAERIRRAIESQCAPTDSTEECGKVTISLGVAALSPAHDSVNELVAEADTALYRAKAAGKNRVVVADSFPNPSRAEAEASAMAFGDRHLTRK